MAKKIDGTPVEFIETTSTNLTIAQENYRGAVIHVHDDNGDDNLYIGDDRVTDRFNIGDSDILEPTRKVGGLDASTLGDLKNRTMSQILMDILRPDRVIPTPKEPLSVTISYNGGNLIKVGTLLPSKSDITSVIDDGQWSDGTPYAGGHNDIVLNMNPETWGGNSVEGKYTISGSVEFTEGEKPKDNFGKEYPGYVGGDVVDSNEIIITSVHPIYINDGNIITVMKEHIVNYIDGAELKVTIPPEVETPEPVKFMVKVPSEFSTFGVKKYNQLTGKYDIDVPMIFVPETNMYIREDNTYTNTTHTQYKINLKK